MKATPSREYGFVLLAVVALGWGLNWPAMKLIVAEVPPWQFRAVTGIVGGLALFAMARMLGEPLAVPRGHWLPLAAAAFFNVTSWFVGIAYGIMLMGGGHASILAFTMPIWLAVLSVLFLREQLTPRRIASLIMGAAGVSVLLSHDFGKLGASPWGAIVTLGAAFNWAIGVLIQKRVAWTIPPVSQAAWQIALGSVPIVFIAAAVEPFVYHRAGWPAIASSLYLCFFALAFCYYAWFTAVRIFPTHVTAISSLSVPIVGVVSTSAFLGEPFGWREITALVLVVGAVALVLLQPQPAAEKDVAAEPAAPSKPAQATPTRDIR
jgi:drug/metabolite transporter (DMT)-like permease